MDDEIEDRELTTSEGLVKVLLAAGAAFLVKKLVEGKVEEGFRRFRP